MPEKSLENSELYESRFGYGQARKDFRFYLTLLLVFFVWFCVRTALFTAYGVVSVDGTSMAKTLKHGDCLLVDCNVPADYGDVIVVDVRSYAEFDGTGTQFLIKRLIAKGGDSVYCEDGQLYIRYQGTDEYVSLGENYAYYQYDKAYYDFGVYELAEDEIFFLGDNRQGSSDSRYEEGFSRLEDRLYKSEDIYGVVPSFVMNNRLLLKILLFPAL